MRDETGIRVIDCVGDDIAFVDRIGGVTELGQTQNRNVISNIDVVIVNPIPKVIVLSTNNIYTPV